MRVALEALCRSLVREWPMREDLALRRTRFSTITRLATALAQDQGSLSHCHLQTWLASHRSSWVGISSVSKTNLLNRLLTGSDLPDVRALGSGCWPAL